MATLAEPLLTRLHHPHNTQPIGDTSFQLTVLKVLARQSGRASIAEVRRAVEILMNSGRDWIDRMKRLAEQAPDLNIFSANLIIRDALG
ncbi:hypothetical protein AOQ73_40500 [Bradyrhizobium pachyrhizi]|uniref:hypothetical protein n=1 Tax=Bradyrhizobium pachyrhizi TaxID=280333 RepID=UPI0007050644|nr:hypothetical protein [Bradyrhizobium pachyrhizi]KRP84802.1 hypothetical protein AOQ73_40500 [Bradyrhizobium pachyrhizi]